VGWLASFLSVDADAGEEEHDAVAEKEEGEEEGADAGVVEHNENVDEGDEHSEGHDHSEGGSNDADADAEMGVDVHSNMNADVDVDADIDMDIDDDTDVGMNMDVHDAQDDANEDDEDAGDMILNADDGEQLATAEKQENHDNRKKRKIPSDEEVKERQNTGISLAAPLKFQALGPDSFPIVSQFSPSL
jgi:hypothetical protein